MSSGVQPKHVRVCICPVSICRSSIYRFDDQISGVISCCCRMGVNLMRKAGNNILIECVFASLDPCGEKICCYVLRNVLIMKLLRVDEKLWIATPAFLQCRSISTLHLNVLLHLTCHWTDEYSSAHCTFYRSRKATRFDLFNPWSWSFLPSEQSYNILLIHIKME